MKISFKIINKIPRLGFEIINKINGVFIYNTLYFPSKFRGIIKSLLLVVLQKYPEFNETSEEGMKLAHLRYTRTTDNIFAVGLGDGTTMINALKLIDNTSRYTVVEPSTLMINRTKKNLLVNNLQSRNFSIINGYLGDKIYNLEETNNELKINLFDYDFDILELDCEGAEIEIIKSLYYGNKLPRMVYVEVHPWNYEPEFSTYNGFNELLLNLNYRLVMSFSEFGEIVDLNEVESRFIQITNFVNQPVKSSPIVLIYQQNDLKIS